MDTVSAILTVNVILTVNIAVNASNASFISILNAEVITFLIVNGALKP